MLPRAQPADKIIFAHFVCTELNVSVHERNRLRSVLVPFTYRLAKALKNNNRKSKEIQQLGLDIRT
jgi:hypothetical protein